MMSHPTWVRGLKLEPAQGYASSTESHPTWVRGLKLCIFAITIYYTSRTLRGCVD